MSFSHRQYPGTENSVVMLIRLVAAALDQSMSCNVPAAAHCSIWKYDLLLYIISSDTWYIHQKLVFVCLFGFNQMTIFEILSLFVSFCKTLKCFVSKCQCHPVICYSVKWVICDQVCHQIKLLPLASSSDGNKTCVYLVS